MKRAIFALVVVTFLSKILGFAREVVLAYSYGASAVSDAYIISITIPSVILGFVSTGLSTAYIPLYTDIMIKNGIEEADCFSNNVINISLVFCTLIALFGVIFSDVLVKIFASGFNSYTSSLASSYMA